MGRGKGTPSEGAASVLYGDYQRRANTADPFDLSDDESVIFLRYGSSLVAHLPDPDDQPICQQKVNSDEPLIVFEDEIERKQICSSCLGTAIKTSPSLKQRFLSFNA